MSLLFSLWIMDNPGVINWNGLTLFFFSFFFFFSCFTVRCVIMLVSQKCRKIPTSFAVKRVDFVRYSYSVKFTLYPDCQLGYLYMIFYKGV